MTRFPLAVVVAATFLTLALLPLPAAAAPPPTVYETGPMSPQNMDYDAENKMFTAHMGWLNDKQIHYYKFRMYTPDTYPTMVKMEGEPRIPIMPVYLPTSNGTLAGSVGKTPVIRYHTADGENYSDFVELYLVNMSNGEAAPKSWEDVDKMAADPVKTGIIVNMPVVPTGSKLQDPVTKGTAPIKPLMVHYKGDMVQTFTFETSSKEVADLWNPVTREGPAALAGSGYEMTVAQMTAANNVRALPIWHVNQYFDGVTPGVNSGGPSEMGMRNVIDTDRNDPGYTPLWQVWWVSQLPPDYRPDQASHPDQFTEQNGFHIMKTPMFVNCPNVGPHGGGAPNAAKATSFTPVPRLLDVGSVKLQGALVMMGDATVQLMMNDTKVAENKTNMMGGYSFMVNASALKDGVNDLHAVDKDGNEVAHWMVLKGATVATPTLPMMTPTPTATPTSGTPPATTPTTTPAEPADAPLPAALAVLGAAVAALALARRRR